MSQNGQSATEKAIAAIDGDDLTPTGRKKSSDPEPAGEGHGLKSNGPKKEPDKGEVAATGAALSNEPVKESSAAPPAPAEKPKAKPKPKGKVVKAKPGFGVQHLGKLLIVPWTDVHEDERFDCRMYDELKTLVAEVIEVGKIHTPLRCVVIHGRLVLYDGYRRKRALRALSKNRKKYPPEMFDGVPVIVDAVDPTPSEVLARKMRLEPKPIMAVESGRLMNVMAGLLFAEMKLVRKDMADMTEPTPEVNQHIAREIGSQLHVRIGEVHARMSLINATAKVLAAVRRGVVSVGDAAEIVRMAPTKKAQDELVADRTESKGDDDTPRRVRRIRILPKMKRKRPRLNPVQRSALLVQVAQAFTEFVRSDSPAKPSNDSWVSLEEVLRRVRNLNFENRL